MKVLPINNNITAKPSFQSCYRFYSPRIYQKYDVFDKELIRTSTNLFRDDLKWSQLAKYIKAHFDPKGKVNAYSLACSDGSEAYSYVISILENIPQELQQKFLPLKASDLDKEAIKAAKSGRLNIYPIEFLTAENRGIDLFNYMTDKNVSLTINGDTVSESDQISSYKVIDKVCKNVEFKRSDILTELKRIKDDGNSVIMCRNVFPYLKPDYVDEVIKNAREILKDGSLFIIGEYDEAVDMGNRLLKNGFFKPLLNSEFIFMRGNKQYIFNL